MNKDQQWKLFIVAHKQLHDWKYLTPYPELLYKWQKLHIEDVKPIAALASHRIGKHHFCGAFQQKCEAIDKFIEENSKPLNFCVI